MIYEIMFYGGITGVIITLPLSIFLFFKLQIKEVVYDLMGINFSNSYERTIKKRHETDGELKEVSSEIRLRKEHERLTKDQQMDETELLTNETTILNEKDLAETMLLSDDATTILEESSSVPGGFIVEKNIIMIHARPIMVQEGEVVGKAY